MNGRLVVAERILLTLWVGGMWATGYLVAPMLFQMLDDRALAGTLAGRMFTGMSYVGLACGGLLLLNIIIGVGARVVRVWQAWVVLGMILLTAIGEFVLQPRMAELRAAGLATGGELAQQFGRLHGAASTLFLITSLLGLALVIAGRLWTRPSESGAGDD